MSAKSKTMTKEQKPTRRTLERLLDEAVRPTCVAAVHRLPPEGQALLKLARKRLNDEVRVSPAILARVIKREFAVTLSDDAIGHYLRSGCNCEE